MTKPRRDDGAFFFLYKRRQSSGFVFTSSCNVIAIIVNDFYGSKLGNPQYSDHFCPINIYDMNEIRLTKEDFLSGLAKLEGVIKVADGIALCYKGYRIQAKRD